MFGIRGRKVEVFTDSKLQSALPTKGNISNLNTKTLYVVPCTGEKCETQTVSSLTSPSCHFTNVEYTDTSGKSYKGTLLLENPRGDTCTMLHLQSQVTEVY